MPEPVLRNSPLSTVVCELRFDAPAPDQSAMLRLNNMLGSIGLTEYSTEEGIQLAMRPGEMHQMPIKRYRFAAADGSRALALDANTFAFETAAYNGIDRFLEAWEPVAHGVGETLNLQARTRLGLRYVNEVPLTGDEPGVVGQAVNPLLLPPWNSHEHLGSLSVSLQELRFGQEEGELTFRHGLQRTGGGAPPVYLLDFDHYEQRLRGFDVADDAQRLRRFNATVYDVFRWSITDGQYEAFDPEERPDA